MKNNQHRIYNGHPPVQPPPCRGSVSFDAAGDVPMIEFAFVIAASMRIMAETDQLNRLRGQQQKKEAETAPCFA